MPDRRTGIARPCGADGHAGRRGGDPYGEARVCVVGAGVLDSPAGRPEKQQKSPANADFDPFSPEISFRFPLFIDLRLSLHGRG